MQRISLPILLLLCWGCASYQPVPAEEVPFLERAVEETRDGITVRVAVPTREEAKQLFGVDLAEKKIQPVWMEIRNDTDRFVWFMRHGLDPGYFSAREAAYMHHYRLRPSTNTKMDDHFAGLDIDPAIPAGESRSGFAFSNLKLGTKEVRIRLFSEERVEDFHFYVTVSGFRADWQEVDFDELYGGADLPEISSDEDLYQVLSELPCCTTREVGTGEGDPINIVLIGWNPHEVLIRSGWDETELLTAGSAWKTFKAFFGGEYRYSPMSALYVFDRAQDGGFQKARDTIHQRNHLRLWLAPWRFQGTPVWVGSITRDIGVYFTTRAWNLTTHAIDPDVDEARAYLTEDLATAEALVRVGRVPGVGAATPDEPHRNLMFAPWWTDGYREVYELAEEGTRVPLEQIHFFPWPDEIALPAEDDAPSPEAGEAP